VATSIPPPPASFVPEPEAVPPPADTPTTGSEPDTIADALDEAPPDPPVRPVTPPPAPQPRPTRSAPVTVTPTDAVISQAGTGDYLGLGRTQLDVALGDSLLLDIRRDGYVPQRRAFIGAPLNVSLVPDSASVTFQTNVPVEVVVDLPGGPLSLGDTDVSARLPTGEYRVRFVSDVSPEWSTTARLGEAGGSYRISKMDYPTRGVLVVVVQGGWANVSVDGSPVRESPARFDDLRDFPHVVRLSRDGYETIIDTVAVVPGQVTTRQYTLRPSR